MATRYRQRALATYPNECARCGAKGDLVVHHIDRNRKNGELGNLQVLCRDCHHYEHHQRHRDEWYAELQQYMADEARLEREAYEAIAKRSIAIDLPCVLTNGVSVDSLQRVIAVMLARQKFGEGFSFREIAAAERGERREGVA